MTASRPPSPPAPSLSRWPTPSRLGSAGPSLRRLCSRTHPKPGTACANDITHCAGGPDRHRTRRSDPRAGHRRTRHRSSSGSTSERARLVGRDRGDLLERHPFAQLLISMPGIGTKTGATILTEIGDGSFPDRRPPRRLRRDRPVTRHPAPRPRRDPARHGNHRLKSALFLLRSVAAVTGLQGPTTPANAPKANATTPPSCA